MIYLHPYDALILTLAVQGAQWATALLLFFKFRRESRLPLPKQVPPATIVIPCKGVSPEFIDNVSSFLNQDYPAPLEVLFVVPSQTDPAAVALEKLKATVLVSDRKPTTSSGKIADLLFALDHLPEESEVILFSDADVRVEPNWAHQLVGPLEDPRVGVATSAMLYVPTNARISNLVRSAWMMSGVMFSVFMDSVTGQSMALRKKDIEGLGFREAWSTSLLEDLATGRTARARGKRISFVSHAMPVSYEDTPLSEVAEVFTRWMRCIRFDDWRMWFMALPLVSGKTLIALGTLMRIKTWDEAAFFWILEGGFFAMIAWVYSYYLPNRFKPLPALRRPYPIWVALASPLVLALQGWNLTAAAFSSEVRWGGRRYRCLAPGKIQIID